MGGFRAARRDATHRYTIMTNEYISLTNQRHTVLLRWEEERGANPHTGFPVVEECTSDVVIPPEGSTIVSAVEDRLLRQREEYGKWYVSRSDMRGAIRRVDEATVREAPASPPGPIPLPGRIREEVSTEGRFDMHKAYALLSERGVPHDLLCDRNARPHIRKVRKQARLHGLIED